MDVPYRAQYRYAIFIKKKLAVDFRDPIPEPKLPEDGPSENEERMYHALRQLDSAEKAIISLYLEDYSYHEIANITGVSENNVGVKITDKNKLKRILT